MVARVPERQAPLSPPHLFESDSQRSAWTTVRRRLPVWGTVLVFNIKSSDKLVTYGSPDSVLQLEEQA